MKVPNESDCSDFSRVLDIACRIVWLGRTVLPAEAVRHRELVHVRRCAPSALAVELVRADLDEGRQVAVVRAVQNDGAHPSGVRPREAERQVVRFAPGVDEEADLERVGEPGGELLSEGNDVVVEIPRVRIRERRSDPERLSRPRDGNGRRGTHC